VKRYLLFAALACLLFARPLAAVISPNIVLIVTDDEDVVGFQDALDHGLLPDIKTRMVDVGWTAENAFTPESECCPARAMLLKGQYPQNTHVVSNHAALDCSRDGRRIPLVSGVLVRCGGRTR